MRETFFSILVSFALCLSLVIAPAVADGAGYAFHRASENTLTVYGNANLDNVIDGDAL